MQPTPCTAILWIGLLVVSACVDPSERTSDAESLRDPWALSAETSDPVLAAGKQIFVSCASCHLADAGGRVDGTIPRLAGQPAPILERRLKALADGADFLPVMTPFARALTDLERHQVAIYLASLPRPGNVGFGSGRRTQRGAAIYADRCAACHSRDGRGQSGLNAPRLCGQHAAYLLRRLMETPGEKPRLRDPVMSAVAAALSPDDRHAVSDHLSRLRCE